MGIDNIGNYETVYSRQVDEEIEPKCLTSNSSNRVIIRNGVADAPEVASLPSSADAPEHSFHGGTNIPIMRNNCSELLKEQSFQTIGGTNAPPYNSYNIYNRYYNRGGTIVPNGVADAPEVASLRDIHSKKE